MIDIYVMIWHLKSLNLTYFKAKYCRGYAIKTPSRVFLILMLSALPDILRFSFIKFGVYSINFP